MTGSAKQSRKRQSVPDWIASSLMLLAMTCERRAKLVSALFDQIVFENRHLELK
jgi:hypothetical protein